MATAPGIETPVRIVRKKSGHGGHHGGAWKVAYADFVTAMMALFIVLWIVGQSDPVKQAVAGYFRDPRGSVAGQGSGVLEGAATMPEPVRVEQPAVDRVALEQLQADLGVKLALDTDLARLAGQVEMTLTAEGLRIELLEQNESAFFSVGTSQLQPDAARILGLIGTELTKLGNPVKIEGHTDGRAYSTPQGFDNFDLSAERANTARRALVATGLQPARIREVSGFADNRLRRRDAPLDASNRRVSILVLPEHGTTVTP